MAVFEGERIALRKFAKTDREGGRDWMFSQIVQIARGWQRELKLDRCGVGFGGPVNFAEQRVYQSTHVGGWSGFSLRDQVGQALGLPVVIDNDANVGALGEGLCGAGRGYSPVFYMTISTGVGGGIFHHGKIWRGADSFAGELGHITIRPDGPECLCGARGWLGGVCSGVWAGSGDGQRGNA